MKRFWIVFVGIVAALSVTAAAQDKPALQLTFIGEQRIATGTLYKDTGFGGISGISYDPHDNVYYVISDDRGTKGPIRFYTLGLDFDATNFRGVDSLSFAGIQRDDGVMLGKDAADAEGIVFVPSKRTLIWASEMDAETGAPTVREMNSDGRFIRDFAVPDYYIPDEHGSGVSANTSFESMALSPDEKTVYTATESALMQDGPVATLDKGSRSRILVFDFATARPTAEYVYETGPIPHAAVPALELQVNGLSELLVLDDHTLLSLERSFASGVGNTINLYAIDLAGATNVLGQAVVQDKTYTSVTKTLVITLNEGDFGLNIDNIEGMTFGPVIDGVQTMIFVSDNNFNPLTQPYTQFLLFTINRSPDGAGS